MLEYMTGNKWEPPLTGNNGTSVDIKNMRKIKTSHSHSPTLQG